MRITARRWFPTYSLGLFVCGIASLGFPVVSWAAVLLHNSQLSVAFSAQDEAYEIRTAGLVAPVLKSHVGAEVDSVAAVKRLSTPQGTGKFVSRHIG